MGKWTWTKTKREKGRTVLCTLCSNHLPVAHFPFGSHSTQWTHTHTHTHFSTQSCVREERGGGRLIKTLRAVLNLTGWVKHTKRRSLLVSTQTHTLTDVSIHLDCHTHTPPRDLTSSVSQLNYSSPFFPVCLSFPLSPSLSPLSERQTATKTHIWQVVTVSLKQKLILKRSERTYAPDVLLNVLMWLNVPSEATTLGREISFASCCVGQCPGLLSEDRKGLSHGPAG